MINVVPETARWSLTDNNQKTFSGAGCATQTNFTFGLVRITWAPLTGYHPPSPAISTATLANDGAVNFCQVYLPQTAGPAQTQARIVRYILGLPENSSGIDLNGDGLINASDLISSVLLQTPGLPASPAPANGAPGVSTQPTLDWADCAPADAYNLYLWQSGLARPAQPATRPVVLGAALQSTENHSALIGVDTLTRLLHH